MTVENVYVRPGGKRECRVCKRATIARAQKRKRDIARAKKGGMQANSPENAKPEASAAVLEAAADPAGNIRKTAEAEGMAQSTAYHLVDRMETNHPATMATLRQIKTDELKEKWANLAANALDKITLEKLEHTNARDLAWVAGVATDKRQLLDNQPTAIVTHQDRADLSKLLPLLVQEAERRQMKTINGTATETDGD
ncbi:MAG: hypothetical protein GY906_24305 [bacterium]|nr:hypothetical protein [bacterium]